MTYSIVARCSETGRLGVGVQSHYLAAASIVSWVRSGVGAIATQSQGNMMYGARGLELLAKGIAPDIALRQLLAGDDGASTRQVAFVDANGQVAVHTGERCIAYANHVVGEGVSFQANMMASQGVPEAMATSWETTAGAPLEGRIIAALVAAQAAGGDVRGQQSAGIRIAEHVDAATWWEGSSIDLRVDDHARPLEELARLVDLRRAYVIAEKGDDAAAAGEAELAESAFAEARAIAPDSIEVLFWHGVMLANAGRIEAAQDALRAAYAQHDGRRQLLIRLPAAGFLDVDPSVLSELVDLK